MKRCGGEKFLFLKSQSLLFHPRSSAGRMICCSTSSLSRSSSHSWIAQRKCAKRNLLCFVYVWRRSLCVISYVITVQNQKVAVCILSRCKCVCVCVCVCVCAPHPCRLNDIPERGSRMRIGTGLLIHFWGTGIVVKKKRERREEGAEIGRRLRRGNRANRVDKSGCGGEKKQGREGREEREMEMERWSGNQS